MKPTVYVETSVIGYLTMRPSRNAIVAAHQHITRAWWTNCVDYYDLMVSELVIQEVSAGDPKAAQERLEAVKELGLLKTTDEATRLSRHLLDSGAIPQKAAQDALHIAIAVSNGIEYLVTWNCRHIANATIRTQIEEACRVAGYEPAIICTPEELTEIET